LQLLSAGIDNVDAVWFTHAHADHVHGIDDLRVFTVHLKKNLSAFVPSEYEEVIRNRFSYIFDDKYRPPEGTTKPEVRLFSFDPDETPVVVGHRFEPVAVPHGPATVYGFRVGGLGYITDGKYLPEAAMKTLNGVQVLVLNALWSGRPHPTHFNVEEALEVAQTVGAKHTYLTHLSHHVRHQDLVDQLPSGVLPAYDGLSIEII
jgi:phosphoribosyl 1,2-cyclic phosphate phosphodiesterase|tara:strand:- start:7438 stop:8049 length:612 start_codon:yes stop_codon:yes gene_type:complete